MSIDLEKISDSPHLLDLLLQMEDVLDSLDIYVFKNWFSGEVAEGPKVRRYWLDMTLKYPYKKMPDPKAALRLLKHGIRVDFKKARTDDAGQDGVAAAEDKDKTDNLFWLVHISIPRRLIAQMSAEEMDYYDDDVDVDDVEDAKDTGIDDESAFTDDGQMEDGEGQNQDGGTEMENTGEDEGQDATA